MANIPVKFRSIAAAFDEAAREAARSCYSSGSEHSASIADLSDLVNSFLENEIGSEERTGEEFDEDADASENEIDRESDPSNCNPGYDELRISLQTLFHPEKRDRTRRRIQKEVEKALQELSGAGSASTELKRLLMARLRKRGFDAGLCKSKWEKNGQRPSGDHDYIDVNAGGSRYLVEVFLAGEFTIARPAECYASLLDAFPAIFVGKSDDLKQVVRVMCKAIRKSMKSVDLKLPPWRRLAYIETKWLGPYKRTTNEVPTGRKVTYDGAGSRSVGFVAAPEMHLSTPAYCREEFGRKAKKGGIGNLAVVLNNEDMV